MVGWSTMTGIAEADIIFECKIDAPMGDSGEIDREERRSCSVENVLAVIGGVAEPEYSDDRWRGCFVVHLCSSLRLKEPGRCLTTHLDHPPESVPEPAPIIGVPTPSPFPDH